MAQLPQWQPLDGGVAVPEGTGPGRIVVVVASAGAVASGWAPTAALDLARAWSARGEKVVLADGGLYYPTLHAPAQLDNAEGLSDAALFGVSIGRIAQPVDGGSFFLITAGTAVADANSVPGSRRWGRILEGFTEAGVKLLLFVRDGDSGCAAFLGSASDIIVFADQGEGAPAVVRDLEGLVRAVTGPSGPSLPAGASVRPPKEWTSAFPEGRRRVLLMVLAVVVLIALLAAAFGIIDFSPEAAEAAYPAFLSVLSPGTE